MTGVLVRKVSRAKMDFRYKLLVLAYFINLKFQGNQGPEGDIGDPGEPGLNLIKPSTEKGEKGDRGPEGFRGPDGFLGKKVTYSMFTH